MILNCQRTSAALLGNLIRSKQTVQLYRVNCKQINICPDMLFIVAAVARVYLRESISIDEQIG